MMTRQDMRRCGGGVQKPLPKDEFEEPLEYDDDDEEEDDDEEYEDYEE